MKRNSLLLTLILTFALAPLASCAQDLAAEDESWEGLDAEDMAQLEDESGADYDTVEGDLPPTIAAPPSCVSFSQNTYGEWKTATIRNRCSSWQKVRVIWAWAPDTGCIRVAPGGWFKSSRKNGVSKNHGITRPYVTGLRRC